MQGVIEELLAAIRPVVHEISLDIAVAAATCHDPSRVIPWTV